MTLCLCVLEGQAYGQSSTASGHIDTRGMAVYCVYKAKSGIVWLGTSEGLITYGQLLSYNPRAYIRHPLLCNAITDIKEDSQGRLWVTTQSRQYMVYDPTNNELIADARQIIREWGVHTPTYFPLRMDEDHHLWVGVAHQVYWLDGKGKRKKLYILPSSAGGVIDFVNSDQATYVITQKRIFKIPKKTMAVQDYTSMPAPYQGSFNYGYATPKHILWLTYDRHTYRYDEKARCWRSYPDFIADGSLSVYSLSSEVFCQGTLNDYPAIFDGKGDRVKLSTLNWRYKWAFLDRHIQDMYYDGENQNLWVLYKKMGMAVFGKRLDQSRKVQIPCEADRYRMNDVLCMTQDKDGTIWLGTEDDGILHFQGSRQELLKDRIATYSAVTSILSDSHGRLWYGVYARGLFRKDGKAFLKGLSPNKIVEGPNGLFFVMTLRKGLWRIDDKTGEVVQVFLHDSCLNDIVYAKGNVFVCSNSGAYVLDPHTLQWKLVDKRLKESYAALIVCRKHQYMFLARANGKKGLVVFDLKTRRFLLAPDMDTYQMKGFAEDRGGRIWSISNQGLIRFEQRETGTQRITCFPIYGNENSIYNNLAILPISGNRLLLGMNDGYQVVDPRAVYLQMKKDEDKGKGKGKGPCPLMLTSLRINDQYVNPGAHYDGKVIYQADIENVKCLNLTSHQKDLLIECLPKDYVTGYGYTYSYRLKGNGNKWMPMQNFQMALIDIPSGNYTLQVRIQNADQTKERVYDIVTISIAPPFYRSYWAYLIYILFALLVIVAGRFVHQRRKEAGIIMDRNLSLERQRIYLEREAAEKAALAEKLSRENARLEADKPKDPTIMNDDERLVYEVIQVVEKHISDPDFSVEVLSDELHMHRTSLYRKLVVATGQTPVVMIRKIRMKRARQLLEHGHVLVSQVAYQVGYNSTKNFSKHFRNEFGFNPSDIEKARGER